MSPRWNEFDKGGLAKRLPEGTSARRMGAFHRPLSAAVAVPGGRLSVSASWSMPATPPVKTKSTPPPSAGIHQHRLSCMLSDWLSW